MKNVEKKIYLQIYALIFSIFLLIAVIQINSFKIQARQDSTKISDFTIKQYLEHTPLDILNDTAFGSSGYNLPGSGTVGDPYRIEDYNITSTEFDGIHIADTTSYFVIQNCYIEVGDHRGIFLENVQTNRTIINNNTIYAKYGMILTDAGEANITNNYCEGNWIGLRIYHCDTSYIYNNTFYSFWGVTGIYIDESDDCLIENNHCEYNHQGIILQYSERCVVLNNTCTLNNAVEIYAYVSPNTTISNNTCINSIQSGIDLFGSENSSILYNTLYNSDLMIEDDLIDIHTYTVLDNTINNKKLGFFIDEKDLSFSTSEYGKMILINCTNIGISNQNFSDLTNEGIFTNYCDDIVIENNLFDNIGDFGIRGYNIHNLTIHDNNFSNIIWYGQAIDLEQCDDVSISNNWFSENGHSIIFIESDTIDIISNTFQMTTYYDIILDTCNDTLIYDNYFDNSLVIASSFDNYGINLYDTDFTQIDNNTFYAYEGYGIFLETCKFTNITSNLIQDNTKYGIYIDYNSENNTIHHNTFYNNNLGGVQAYDDGVNNTWYDPVTKEGNYWSDWITGNYTIEGLANSEDIYPLGDPLIPIIYEFDFSISLYLIILVLPTILLTYNFRKRKIR